MSGRLSGDITRRWARNPRRVGWKRWFLLQGCVSCEEVPFISFYIYMIIYIIYMIICIYIFHADKPWNVILSSNCRMGRHYPTSCQLSSSDILALSGSDIHNSVELEFDRILCTMMTHAVFLRGLGASSKAWIHGADKSVWADAAPRLLFLRNRWLN